MTRITPCIAGLMATGALSVSALSGAADRGVSQALFGHIGDKSVDVYTLTNAHGVEARIMTYGATIVSLKTPDRTGQLDDIVLGFDSLEPYIAGVPYFGATVGRYANRIANARFDLDGKRYQLPVNNGQNSLHGGVRGFDKRIWSAQVLPAKDAEGVRMTYVSEDGEEGYPGQLTVHVTFQLRDDDALMIEYRATTTAATPINMTNHSYFNLSGDTGQSILDHELTIAADRFTPVDAGLIPTGELRPVNGTAFDFRSAHFIGTRIDADDEQLRLGRGYDENWVLNKPTPHALSLAARVYEPRSGRELEVLTTQPGLQFYSGNNLNGKPSGTGSVFNHRTGRCLETQHFPNSPNESSFPSTILRPGQVYDEQTLLRFRVVKS